MLIFPTGLHDGNTVGAVFVNTGVKGGNVTIHCPFSSSGTRMFFCKESCKEEDVLIETSTDRAHADKYSIKTGKTVTISQLTESDSGRYRCGLGTHLSSASYVMIEIFVVDGELMQKVTKTVFSFNITSEIYTNVFLFTKHLLGVRKCSYFTDYHLKHR